MDVSYSGYRWSQYSSHCQVQRGGIRGNHRDCSSSAFWARSTLYQATLRFTLSRTHTAWSAVRPIDRFSQLGEVDEENRMALQHCNWRSLVVDRVRWYHPTFIDPSAGISSTVPLSYHHRHIRVPWLINLGHTSMIKHTFGITIRRGEDKCWRYRFLIFFISSAREFLWKQNDQQCRRPCLWEQS